jgi:uncharacterized linocin/CFP29 family protein
MSDYLMRDAAPLSAEEWERLDKVVIDTARQYLVGRRFVKLVGPLGAGTEVVPIGVGEKRDFLRMHLIYQDFKLYWSDIEASRRAGMGLELGLAAMAAAGCARQEDKMILGKMLEAAGNKTELGDWSETGNAFEAVVQARKELVADDFYGPYAVVLSPDLYARTQRMARGMGRLEAKLITDLAEGGLFQSPLLEPDQGLVVSLGGHNFDLAVAQDLTVGYMGNEDLDHLFRVLERLVLRIKRPESICKFVA